MLTQRLSCAIGLMTLCGCTSTSHGPGQDAQVEEHDATTAHDAAVAHDGSTRDASDVDAMRPFNPNYSPLPEDGGACPLTAPITLSMGGGDSYTSGSIELRPPATIHTSYRSFIDPSSNRDCTFRPPDCNAPNLPDFVDLLALLHDPVIEAALRDRTSFLGYAEAPDYYGQTSITVGDGQISLPNTYWTPSYCPDAGDIDDEDAGMLAKCRGIPDEVIALRDLIQALARAYQCTP